MSLSIEPKPGAKVAAVGTTDTTVVNSSAETTLCTLAIPSDVSAGDVLEFTAYGDLLNNTAGNVGHVWRVRIGATTALTTPGNTAGTNSIRRRWTARAQIIVASTSDQRVYGRLGITTASGVTWQQFSYGYEGFGTAAEDLTAGKNLVFTVQMDTANALADVVIHGRALTHLRAS